MIDNLMILDDLNALALEAAARFISIGTAAIQHSGRFTLALSGGSTPRALYEILARDHQAFAWDKVHIFWGDERCVPPDHADSNFNLAQQTLLSKVKVLDQNVHRMHGEEEPTQAAFAYEYELRKVFGPQMELEAGLATPEAVPDQPSRIVTSGGISLFPALDLILLGLGADGHTASLFPGTLGLHEARRWVIANHVEQLQTDRLTLTSRVINHAQDIIFLIAGADKASALQSVLQGPVDLDRYPAQLVKPRTTGLTWLVDRAAASLLA
jgi:6-phosphogluconolactonase